MLQGAVHLVGIFVVSERVSFLLCWGPDPAHGCPLSELGGETAPTPAANGSRQPVRPTTVICRITRFLVNGYENPQQEKTVVETPKKWRAGLHRRPVPTAAGGCCRTLETGGWAGCLGKLVPNYKGAQGCCQCRSPVLLWAPRLPEALGVASPPTFGSRVPRALHIPAGAGAGSGPAFALHCVTP